MVKAVRAGESVRAVARRFGVSRTMVQYWVKHAEDKRLDRVDFNNRPSGRAWNKISIRLEQRVLAHRRRLKEHSVLGEFGADAIRASLLLDSQSAPARATVNRVLKRRGALDHVHRVRRAAPPKGWYLPEVANGHAELDSFDWIEDLKIAAGPQFAVLTGTSLHGGLVSAWPEAALSAQRVVLHLQARWRLEGLPGFAQFDNGSVFQGAHQFRDTFGRVTRLCLALGVTPVFAPPREHGFQNAIESFNGLWQAKVWQRQQLLSLAHVTAHSDRYIAAHRARNAARREHAPQRTAFPAGFRLDLHRPLSGQLIFLRRTDERGFVHFLAQRFPTETHWAHRLVRCEVDFDAHQIRCYALRRREPHDHPLLAVHHYHPKPRSFRGRE